MAQLPEPRRYGMPSGDDRLASLIGEAASGDSAAKASLCALLAGALNERNDAAILDALRQAPSQAAYRTLWDALDRAVEGREGERDAGIEARVFALPIVVVTAARRALRVPGALPDVAEIHTLLEQHGAVGTTRNFGLSNALCSLATLEGLKPSEIYRWRAEWAAGAAREVPPADIEVGAGREAVHLRFLVGAGISPKHAPSFVETAANVGAWGLPMTRALARQLGVAGLDLLPMPRPPASLLKAAHVGRTAQLETALNLFASNALRTFRSTVGDPAVMVSAHALDAGAGEVRVSLSSRLDDTLLEGFRWPLHPLDDLDDVERTVRELLRECRVSDVSVVDRLLPGLFKSGALFVPIRELAVLQQRH